MERILKSYLEYLCGRENVGENVPLAQKTTFRIGGPARFFVTVPTKETLVRLIGTLTYIKQKYFIIGAGSNILAGDGGFDGVVIKLGFAKIIDNQCFIYADAGASLKKACNHAREIGLSGLEWACGIPGTVGGAVYMNAGAFGGQIADICPMVDVLVGGEIKTLDAKKLKFAYRKSVFQSKPDHIILGAYFLLKPSDKASIATLENEYTAKRRATQPTGASAGSIFKRVTTNTTDFIPSKEIDALGLKGTTIGGAQISTKHAGFIINMGNATAKDVLALITLVRKNILQNYNIKLQTEITILK